MGDDTIKKSDQRVFDGVAAHLEPHELARVVTDVNDIKSPRRTLRVLLDDWSKSGAQLESGYRHSSAALARRFRFRGYGMDTEVHLLIASDRQLANPTIYARGIHVNVPLRAYFHGGYDYSVNKATSGPLVTGSHSSVDLNFEDTLRHMAEIMNSLHPDRPTYIPPPANIVRQP
jgi:hypothetical protein